jgi:hypothetical protein
MESVRLDLQGCQSTDRGVSADGRVVWKVDYRCVSCERKGNTQLWITTIGLRNERL